MWTCLRSVILKLQRFPGILSGCMARLWHGLHRQETRKISTIGTEGLNFQTCQKRDNIWNVVHTWLTLSLHNMLTIRWGGTIEHLEKHKLWKERNHRRKFYRHMLSPKMFFRQVFILGLFFLFDFWLMGNTILVVLVHCLTFVGCGVFLLKRGCFQLDENIALCIEIDIKGRFRGSFILSNLKGIRLNWL